MSRVAVKMIGDCDAVSDIIQEVFVNLYYKLNNGSEIRYPKSWLYRATCNKCIDSLRKQKRFQSIDFAKDLESGDEATEKQEEKATIFQAVSKLKPKEKSLAILYSEGLSYKEIAAATGIRITSIGKFLSRTLKKIKNELKNQRYELY